MYRRIGMVVAAAATGLLLAVAGAQAAGLAATSPVVPAGGKVAGKGYAYYFKRLQQLIAVSNSRTGPIPSCSTVTARGQKVAMLNLNQHPDARRRGPGTVTCNEPAGRAIYVALISITCSTQRGFHGGLTPPSVWLNGPSGNDLVKCAKLTVSPCARGRNVLVHLGCLGSSATLDGHPVNLRPLVTSTGVFFVPKMLGGPARAAAYGVGVLLRGLSEGTHTIQIDVKGGWARPRRGSRSPSRCTWPERRR